jgi:CRISPR-associated protein Cas1
VDKWEEDDLLRKLLNTLYVTNPDAYLAREGETILVRVGDEVALRIPVLNVEAVVCFGYLGMSPALMRLCVENNVGISFISTGGRFLARVTGPVKGNVLLRRAQFEASLDDSASADIARCIISGKLLNARAVLQRGLRDHPDKVDADRVGKAADAIARTCRGLSSCGSTESVRGAEGDATESYFSVLDELILSQKEDFYMKGRNRRPPLDRFNALLSFLYALVYSNATASLETVGLDPAVGFLHRFRSGRNSLALDLMEELRPYLADRLALTLVNRQQIKPRDFLEKETGAVLLTDDGRKKVLEAFQQRKRETVTHPFLGEKMEIGLIPYVQSLLLARYLRGDLDAYPPFLSDQL